MKIYWVRVTFLSLSIQVFWILSGCQHPRYREFESVKTGMSKDQVLETAGGPSISDRKEGQDRWTYKLYDHPDGPTVREIYFLNGVATYIGPKPLPLVSAEQQDAWNEVKNRQAEQHEQERSFSRQQSYDVQRFDPVESETP
jgi:outer membrane protein assembly factor BamE (lipoprotein component of BamABCDE complex)